jgi:outer membrane protein OmpA-like peptidoglycan-associated protein
LVLLSSLTGCATHQLTRWECAAIGAALGAGAGAGAGIAINENTGDHENGVAGGLGGAGVGLVVGGVTGYLLCPPPPPPPPQKIILRGVHFDFDKAVIRPVDQPVLDEAAETLKSNPNVKVEVNGYCDAICGIAYNLRLSQRRAEAVAGYLEDKGIPPSQLIPRGLARLTLWRPTAPRRDVPKIAAWNCCLSNSQLA